MNAARKRPSARLWLRIVVPLATLAAAVVAVAGPAEAAGSAQAGEGCYQDPVDSRATCYRGTPIISASTGKYVSVNAGSGIDVAGGNHGWEQHVQLEFLTWSCSEWWSLELPARSRLASAGAGGGALNANSTYIGWEQAFRISYGGSDAGGRYWSIKHLASDRFLTAYPDGRLRADSTNFGWEQAFRIPGLDGYYTQPYGC